MDRQTNKTAQQTSNSKAECCTDSKCESGLRNNYFEGKRLTADSFRVEQKYLLERRYLLNRAIHGWGVVYGYAIVATDDNGCGEPGLKIGAGLALDKCGRELVEVGAQIKVSDQLIVLDDEGKPIKNADAFANTGANDCWLLSVHYAEQKTSPLKVEDHCRCEHQEWDNTCETVRYSLQQIDCEDCCRDFGCELECDCATGRCCEESADPNYSSRQDAEVLPNKRGGCNCLCKHLTDLSLDAECGHWCERDEPCARVRVDVRNGVPLACVQIVPDDCGSWTFGTEVEACGPRRLVKRNDLLFDLIRGCDLTYIAEIGWKEWHRQLDPVPFADFSLAFGQSPDPDPVEFVTDKFFVRFSRPVVADTLRPDCFTITIWYFEHRDGSWEGFRVPIVRVDTTNFDQNVPPGHVWGGTIVVDGSWVDDGLRGSARLFEVGETWIEVEVRGDFIVDCNGQTVDANAVGLSKSPSGNGTPGGTFLSTFHVTQAEPSVSSYRRRKGVSS